MKKPLIPFSFMPASWGLKGKSRERAQVEYEYTGYERELRLAKIDHGDSPAKLAFVLLEIEANHGHIDDYEYDVQYAKLKHNDNERDLKVALLEVECHHGRITERERDRGVADARGEPYVTIINSDLDVSRGINGFAFEFDWNDHWIELLQKNGYVGLSEEHIMQQWFDAVCMESHPDNTSVEPPPLNSRMVQRRGPAGSDGTAEYS